MSVIREIQEHYPELTKSEKKVADFILSNLNRVIHSTINDIKQIINVGDATIIRFCQTLGYSGYSDLKIEIAKELMNEIKDVKKTTPLLEDIFEALKQTDQMIDLSNIKNVVNLIKDSKRIFIFGVGHSALAAKELQSQFMRLGIQSYFVDDNHLQLHAASAISSADIGIFFSLTGRTKEIVELAALTKDNGGKVIGITNYLLSPLANFSDIVIQTSTDEFMDGGSISGKISQLYIIDLLVNEYQKSFDLERIITVREKALRSIIKRQIPED